MQTVTLSLFRYGPWHARAWAFAMMGLARPVLARMPDIGFWKLFGSGTGEGFTPVPNTAVSGVLACWPDPETAQARLSDAWLFRRYRAWAAEHFTLYLTPISARGQWSGQTPFEVSAEAAPGPVAALTRATIRPRAMLKFWGQGPAISARIGANADVLFKIGVGEMPLLRQVTFSVWPSPQEMAAFARQGGPHAEAIRAVRDGGWFREELYARFHVQRTEGTWEGKRPLADVDLAA